ncbi:hypothetical protein [uncultured Clostridium sp.]|uniref:hypothetical protein n=1 Tax=uncultured Clostridium sp. TaxID=59620 RepID=UPI00260EAA3F|nr:hypothetical protein [uncultured Clostridium sp.]
MNKENIKNFISKPFTISFAFILIILVCVIFNILTKGNPFDDIIDYSTQINMVNNEHISDDNLSSNYFIDVCNLNISKLSKIKTSVTNESFSNEFTNHKNILLVSIDKNIELYKNISHFLENVDADTILDNNNKISVSKNELNKLILEARKLKIPLSVDEDKESNLNNAYTYINELIKINRNKKIETSQSIDFKANIDLIYTKFTPLNEDLFSIIKIVKSDGRDLTSVLNSINSNIEIFNDLNIELNSLAIPSGYSDIFKALQKTFNEYIIYINNMRDYVLSEISEKPNKDYLESSKKAYDKTNKELLNYLKLMTETK